MESKMIKQTPLNVQIVDDDVTDENKQKSFEWYDTCENRIIKGRLFLNRIPGQITYFAI